MTRIIREREDSFYRELGFLLQNAQEEGDMEAVRSIHEEMRRLAADRRTREHKIHASTMLGRQGGEASR